MNFFELLKFEAENPDVWKIKLYEYPLWYTVRSKLLTEQVATPSRLSVNMIKNIMPRFESKGVDTLITVLSRPDLLSICDALNHQYSAKNILRIEGNTPLFMKYQSALSWDILRFICQKVVWVFFFKKFKSFKKELSSHCLDKSLDICIKKYFGDVIYLQLINYFFRSYKKIFYTNGIIPDIAKFDLSGKYIEIQHGHISNQHPGYVGIPSINGTLFCWNASTIQRLKKLGYSGKMMQMQIQPTEQGDSIEPNVLFATVNSENFIKLFRSNINNDNFYIKLHPKMTDPNMVNCSHRSVDFSSIRTAIILGTSTILHHLASEEAINEIILVPFFSRERSLIKADYLALVLEEFPELRPHLRKIKVKSTDEFK